MAILESKLRSAESSNLKAIESAGGVRLSYVVVEDEDVAKECIRVLKELPLGRVNFIPLNRIEETSLPRRIR